MSKSAASSPAKANKGSKHTMITYTSKGAKEASSPSALSPAMKSTAASFFKMTLANSPISPSKRPQSGFVKAPNTKDLAILHESRIFKTLVETAQKKNDLLKRNPILQDNNEANVEFRPCVRRLASADRITPCATEVISRARSPGAYNYIYNPPSQDPKPQSIRPFNVLPSESSDEGNRRMRKEVKNSKSEARRNPITEGEEGDVARRVRKPVEQSDALKQMNDKKYLLAAERGCSNKGKVFRDSNITVVGIDYSAIGSISERVQTEPCRPVSAMETKMRGSIKGVLQYDDSPAFRDQGVSDKCTTVRFADVVGAHSQDNQLFARKKCLDYQ